MQTNRWNFMRFQLVYLNGVCFAAGYSGYNYGSDSQAIAMFNIFAGASIAAIKFLSLVSVSKVSLALTLMLWHQVFHCNGLRFYHLSRTLPFLAFELRICLNVRYWVTRLSRLASHSNRRIFLPFVPGTDFLRRRDGYTIFDFFKTLSFCGISPPAIA